MIADVQPSSEADRVRLLRSMHVLDTPREDAFDRLVFTASQLFRVPISLITLVDESRLWFKAQVGVMLSESPRRDVFCGRTIQSNDPYVVEDTMRHAAAADHPLVLGPPFIRFYAGAPLLGPDGLNVGTICILDRRPRIMMPEDLGKLRVLAATAMTLLKRSRRGESAAGNGAAVPDKRSIH